MAMLSADQLDHHPLPVVDLMAHATSSVHGNSNPHFLYMRESISDWDNVVRQRRWVTRCMLKVRLSNAVTATLPARTRSDSNRHDKPRATFGSATPSLKLRL